MLSQLRQRERRAAAPWRHRDRAHMQRLRLAGLSRCTAVESPYRAEDGMSLRMSPSSSPAMFTGASLCQRYRTAAGIGSPSGHFQVRSPESERESESLTLSWAASLRDGPARLLAAVPRLSAAQTAQSAAPTPICTISCSYKSTRSTRGTAESESSGAPCGAPCCILRRRQ